MTTTLIFDSYYEEDDVLYTPTVVTTNWTAMYRSENTIYVFYLDIKNSFKMSINTFVDMVKEAGDGVLDLRDWQCFAP